jgi:ribosomal-protein-alanine N-acetyltransferase
MYYKIHPITNQEAEDIATWLYPSPYKMYNLSLDVIPKLLDPLNRYFAVRDPNDRLVGYCCFGSEARVMGGNYIDEGLSILDVGVGMQPDRIGKGEGIRFVNDILFYGMKRYNPIKFRVTIADFNKRSLRTFMSLGFEETNRFTRPSDQLMFIQLERPVCLNRDFNMKKRVI